MTKRDLVKVELEKELCIPSDGNGNIRSFSEVLLRFGELEAEIKFGKLGYFSGNLEKDASYVKKFHEISADDAMHLPGLLAEIVRSSKVAVVKLGERYPTLSPEEIEGKVAGGEIPNPYSLRDIEEVILENLISRRASITVQPAELQKKPDWWDEFSPDFQKVLMQYVKFPGQ